jgi:hypothetical protein
MAACSVVTRVSAEARFVQSQLASIKAVRDTFNQQFEALKKQMVETEAQLTVARVEQRKLQSQVYALHRW